MNNTAAVVVTFNRKNLLLECLHGLVEQTLKVQKIFVVDNNSTDGTQEYLRTNLSQNPLYDLTFLEENTGGAGGFHTGVQKAFEAGYEWIWLMDDDITPKKDCLDTMMSYGEQSKCIHPSKFYSETGKRHRWYGYVDPRSGRSIRAKDDGFSNPNTKYLTVNIGCFEGMLIHREIVEKIGYPDPRFFIVDDDLIYGHLASFHTKVYYLRDAIFYKNIYKEQICSFLGLTRPFQTPFTLYFNVRNQFLKLEYFRKSKEANLIISYIFIALKSLKLLVESLFFFRSIEHLKTFTYGLRDGIRHN